MTVFYILYYSVCHPGRIVQNRIVFDCLVVGRFVQQPFTHISNRRRTSFSDRFGGEDNRCFVLDVCFRSSPMQHRRQQRFSAYIIHLVRGGGAGTRNVLLMSGVIGEHQHATYASLPVHRRGDDVIGFHS